MKILLQKFWNWYERHYRLNVTFAALLFALQLGHFFWMSAHVAPVRFSGISYFPLQHFWQVLIALIDFLEIPAIVTTSLLYLHEFRKTGGRKNLWLLFFINTQWLHIFWITDEIILERADLPPVLAWLAIFIDYLELPVVYDTMRKTLTAWRK